MRLGVRVGPFFASGSTKSKGNLGCGLIVLAVILIVPWELLHWWSLFIYIPVGLLLVMGIIARRSGEPEKQESNWHKPVKSQTSYIYHEKDRDKEDWSDRKGSKGW